MDVAVGRFIVVVELPARGIAVEGALLGRIWPVQGIDAEVSWRMHLPRRPDRPLADYVSEIPSLGPPGIVGAAAQPALRRFDSHRPAWGALMTSNQSEDEVVKAVVRRVVFDAPADAALCGDVDESGRQYLSEPIQESIESWVEGFAEWIEVLAGADLREPVYDDLANRVVCDVFYREPGGSLDSRVPILRVLAASVYREPRSVTTGNWEDAIERAATGTRPPQAHRLLRDALAAWVRDDHRTAVIDAATASEVALSAAIRVHLGQSDEAAVEQLVSSTRGVAELFDIYAAIAEPLTELSRGRLIDRLARPRNNVVHADYRPNRAEAKRALDVSRSLVKQIAPLDPPEPG